MDESSSAIPRPDSFTRRSQLYRWHLQAGAEYGDHDGTVVCYSDPEQERALAGRLALTDLSTLPRVGFKGRDTLAWVQQPVLELPEAPNQTRLHTDGSLVARLSQEELLILSDLQLSATLVDDLQRNWSMESTQRVYLLPRADSHCWFALTGCHAATAFSKLCGVDLRARSFAHGAIAQTSLARVNAIIIRHDLGTTPGFYILSDVSSAEFLWTCLLDAMVEFEGGPVGIAALLALAESH